MKNDHERKQDFKLHRPFTGPRDFRDDAMTLFAIFIAFLGIQAGDIPPERGTLCVLEKNDQRCASAEGTALNVVPADAARTFVWASADGSRLVLGSIPAKASTVSLDEKSRANVLLSIAGDRNRGWPLDTRLTFAAKEWKWGFPMSAKTVTRLRSVRVPPGPYVITIAASIHAVARRTVNARANVALGEVALKTLPLISGRVVDTKDEPVAGAQFVRPDGKVQAVADEQRRFRSELAEPFLAKSSSLRPVSARRLSRSVAARKSTSARFISARDASSHSGSRAPTSKTCFAFCRTGTSPFRSPPANCPRTKIAFRSQT